MATRRTPAQEERAQKRRVAIFGIIMIFLMVVSPIAYYSISSPVSDDQMTYGEYTFTLESRANGGSVLVTEIDGRDVEFQNLPIQVTSFDMPPATISLLQGAQQVILAADPALELQDASTIDYARLQLGLAIPKTVNAMTHEDSRYALPVINCSYASPAMPVVLLMVTNDTAAVSMDGACIIVEGTGRDLLRVKDRIIFEYYGILVDGEVPGR